MAEGTFKTITHLKKTITPDDIIAVLLLNLKEIPLNARKIHTAVNKLKEKHPETLKEFVFSKGDIYPFSRLLEKILFRLQNSTLINPVGPDFKIAKVPETSKTYIREKVLPLFPPQAQEELLEMAKEFQELIMQ